VVFSCAPENWFKTYSLAVPLRTRVRTANRPHVKPLVDILDSYGGYGVVLIDKQTARLLNFHLGKLSEETDVFGENVRRTKRGGGSQATGRRGGVAGQTDYAEEVAERNMRDVVETATRYFREKEVRRILIGGSEDNVAQFRSLLPKAWQSLVVGTFPVSMNASHNEILERAIKVGQEAEIRHEIQLAKKVVTSAAKGKGGVIGLDDTLYAVKEKRVLLLLVREGYREPGRRCLSCGYLSASTMHTCPYCGGELEQIADTIEMVVRNVIQSGGEVEIMRADQDIPGFDQIGALLRY
jgi:peptide chain release factor subunit 1